MTQPNGENERKVDTKYEEHIEESGAEQSVVCSVSENSCSRAR